MSAPSVYEQYMLELINKARKDPNAEAQRLGIDLNDNLAPGTIDGSQKHPLAFVFSLNNSAAKHSISMLANNYFSHTGNDGSSVSDRVFADNWAAEAGSGWVIGENISLRASTGDTFGFNTQTIESHHNGLFKSSGHRTNLMNDRFSEIGIGQETGSYTNSSGTTFNFSSMLTQNFADGGRTYLTGVVIDDKDKDQFYDIGEGLGSVTITATGAAGTFTTSSWDAGGYSLAIKAGTYSVTFSGGALNGPITRQVTVGSENVKLDAFAQAGQQQTSGTSGRDSFNATTGNDIYDGKDGLDVVVIAASQNQLNTSVNGKVVTVTGGGQGTDTFTNVERLQLNDGTLAFDTDGNAGQAYRIYKAAFARDPDNGGLKYWIGQIDNGTGLIDVAKGFLASSEFQSIYGSNPTSDQFVSKLYTNILGREGEDAGLSFWKGELDSGRRDMAQVLTDFSESPENIAGVGPAINDGIWYT